MKIKMVKDWTYADDTLKEKFLKKGEIYDAIEVSDRAVEVESKDKDRSSRVTTCKSVIQILNDEMLEGKVKTGTIETEKVGNWEHNIIHERPDSEHYTDSGIDVWQFADANFGYDELFGFHRINVIKYVTRFGKKNGRNIRDLEKAKAVIEEMIRMEIEGE